MRSAGVQTSMSRMSQWYVGWLPRLSRSTVDWTCWSMQSGTRAAAPPFAPRLHFRRVSQHQLASVIRKAYRIA
jgi:hypothetical protein